MLGGQLGAARGLEQPTLAIEPVIVARHNLLQHRLIAQASNKRMVEHLIEHHLKSRGVQIPHHFAELGGAAPSCLTAEGLRAFQHGSSEQGRNPYCRNRDRRPWPPPPAGASNPLPPAESPPQRAPIAPPAPNQNRR